jgi:ACT domain-containing protein
MKHDYLIVHESILPSYYALVIEVRQLIEQQGMNTSTACKQMGISRSTY